MTGSLLRFTPTGLLRMQKRKLLLLGNTCGMIRFREAQEENSQRFVTMKSPVVCSYRLQVTIELTY